ncbi:MAG: hypothetical protein A3D64_03195 [Candidatus Wildermuthbacteria bacterium RIFCSPHIGHO2_02_FULL_49_9]|uniref:Uncharacterized protein n=2 Tax=Parcubacteria group TaxID=1794811 RepID=A0A1F6BXS1_9BACT|nr:MAG: hypothetical protein A3A21_04175 [Candidatus Jorgensenbacteria bacterium RIFCSPLOWO2_01_FULL_45_25b]OHA70353.1 MAG: hypothetical protein A3D64_03195 [Candidatus Wildermuthbacteria bacterium RIFCSPHIGHO2_02_FULL_49_9]
MIFMRRFSFHSFIFKASAFFVFAGLLFVFPPPSFAQSNSIKKATQDVQESVDTLVSAKDDNLPNDFAFRLDTFKKVIDLSISEAKDLKLKILLLDDKDPLMKTWKEKMVSGLNNALPYFEARKKAGSSIRDLASVKKRAQEFKEWRDAYYLPFSEQITDFLFVLRGEEILDVATSRLSKIQKDIQKLEKSDARRASALNLMLKRASDSIQRGEGASMDASRLFRETYLAPLTATSSKEVATSTSSEEGLLVSIPTQTESTVSASSSQEDASTSPSLPPQPLSIKDLVRSSFGSVKDAYQVFIEMSNSVRELP